MAQADPDVIGNHDMQNHMNIIANQKEIDGDYFLEKVADIKNEESKEIIQVFSESDTEQEMTQNHPPDKEDEKQLLSAQQSEKKLTIVDPDVHNLSQTIEPKTT